LFPDILGVAVGIFIVCGGGNYFLGATGADINGKCVATVVTS